MSFALLLASLALAFATTPPAVGAGAPVTLVVLAVADNEEQPDAGDAGDPSP